MIFYTKYKIFWKYLGITIFPFIFINKSQKGNEVIINHEKTHLRQQIELLWIIFFIWYGIEFVIRYFQYKNWAEAYRNISFEREAYANEKNFFYNKEKKFFSFIRYL